MKEIWKDIEGYEGLYQVSSYGSVKSLKRKGCAKDRTLKPYLSSNGYYLVGLLNVKKINKRIHRLVITAFIKNADNKPCINHKNGIKTDNNINNLEWCTHSENMIHAVKLGLIASPRYWLSKFGKDHNSSKSVAQYSISGKIIETFGGQKEAGRITGVTSAGISKTCRGKQKMAGGYLWKFIEDAV